MLGLEFDQSSVIASKRTPDQLSAFVPKEVQTGGHYLNKVSAPACGVDIAQPLRISQLLAHGVLYLTASSMTKRPANNIGTAAA